MSVNLNLQIRTASINDIENIYNLYNSLSPDDLYMRFFSFKKITEEEIKNIISRKALVTLIAEIDSNIIGEASLYEDGEFSLVVSPNYRKMGIGTRLVEELINQAKQHKLDKIKFYTLPDNIPMIKIGKKLDFSLKFDEDEVFGIKYIY
jgi:N-acetylglutamate synthase-like GNAT family acetyltransferase